MIACLDVLSHRSISEKFVSSCGKCCLHRLKEYRLWKFESQHIWWSSQDQFCFSGSSFKGWKRSHYLRTSLPLQKTWELWQDLPSRCSRHLEIHQGIEPACLLQLLFDIQAKCLRRQLRLWKAKLSAYQISIFIKLYQEVNFILLVGKWSFSLYRCVHIQISY